MKKHVAGSIGVVFLAALIAAFAPGLSAQEPYKLPPKEVVDILDAPPTPMVLMSPARDTMALAAYEAMPSIAYVSRPILRVAGIRITPFNSSRQVLRFFTGLDFMSLKTGATRPAGLPEGVRFSSPSWSPDGRSMALLRYTDSGVELWVADPATGAARALGGVAVNAVTLWPRWLADSRRLLVAFIPQGRGPAPEPPRVPAGPDIQESTPGRIAQTATYQDLLQTAFDETVFAHYATSQLALVDTVSGEIRKVGNPGIFAETSPSPDMSSILVERIQRPYSHSVPYYGFARRLEIWDSDGRPVKLLADLPSDEGVPMNGVPTGPRDIEWQAAKPAALLWVEALDGGDPEKDAPFRDRLMVLDSPLADAPREALKLKDRSSGNVLFAAPGLVLAAEYDWRKRWRTTWLAHLDRPAAAPQKIFDLSAQDRYGNPGSPVLTSLPTGQQVVLKDKDWIYLEGYGASPLGDHPFLDRLNLASMKKERLFECRDPFYETFVDFEGGSRSRIITSRESRLEPPNYFVRDLRSKKVRPLTDFKDPAPQLLGVKKERLTYTRDDGVKLSGTLYVPADHQPGTRLPVVVWAYPIEYSDAGTAGQVRGSVNRFTFYRGASELFFVTQGYAVLDNAEMPVVGDPKTMNDTYVQQIVANAAAAIRKLDELGVADPRRVGVGGHSYGAFMTANLLAHCDLFAAGIARSGAYNRTLTPFGFQSERRTLWQAPETYIKVSPFMQADKINEPVLLIHGEADNNSGTFPIQSERLFAALNGFGATARLVMLPCESHGYSARESVLDVLAESIAWFDRYVKNREK